MSTDILSVIDEIPNNLILQIYLFKDKSINEELINIALANGVTQFIFTVDLHVFGKREKDLGNCFSLPMDKTIQSFKDVGIDVEEKLRQFDGALELKEDVSWKDVEWLSSLTKGKLLLKGFLDPNDIIKAQDCNINGIILSNHGGRQLDGCVNPIDVLKKLPLEDIKVDLFLDSGVRRGRDVIIALALGVKAVFIGRPILYGLGCAGQLGVEKIIDIFLEEIRKDMMFLGCKDIAEIDRGILYHV